MGAEPRAGRPVISYDDAISVGAAVDIGSNSVHLLVAVIGDGWLQPLRDTSDLLGLGDVVDRDGTIPRDARRRVADVLATYVETARRSQADSVTLVGTEPLRRAANADKLVADVLDRTGEPIHVITERDEALLTFIGVTRGRLPESPLVAVDIGGGSTDIAIWVPGEPLVTCSIPLGSARLTNAIVKHEPPTTAEMAELFAAARAATADLPSLAADSDAHAVARAVFVGGTATNVARLGTLSRADLARDRLRLARLTADKVTSRYNVKPRRARQMAAGIAIVDALLDRFGLSTAEAAESSLRDGAIIARARFGDEWLSRLDELVAYPAVSR